MVQNMVTVLVDASLDDALPSSADQSPAAAEAKYTYGTFNVAWFCRGFARRSPLKGARQARPLHMD